MVISCTSEPLIDNAALKRPKYALKIRNILCAPFREGLELEWKRIDSMAMELTSLRSIVIDNFLDGDSGPRPALGSYINSATSKLRFAKTVLDTASGDDVWKVTTADGTQTGTSIIEAYHNELLTFLLVR